MKSLDLTAAVLVIIGALNWGLFGAFRFNLVYAIFGGSILASIIYVLVGIAGVFQLVRLISAPKGGSLAHA
jgi:uncharacterized protein